MNEPIANVEAAAHWDGEEGAHWAAHQEQFDAAVAAHHQRLLDTAAIGPADRILDVGCGTGLTTRDAARAARQGLALGVDLSGPMLARARRLAEAEGVANVRFEQGDVQVHRFEPAAFDLAVSRFGTMFFADPVAAFANVATAVRPGGGLAIMVWQPPWCNQWFGAMRDALAVGRDLPHPPLDAPGPFGLADADRTRRVLGAAGFAGIDFLGVEEPFRIGADADAAYRFTSGLSGMRALLADLHESQLQLALDNLRTMLEDHETVDGVMFDSAAWVVTATKP